MKQSNKNILLIVLLILVVAITRFLPHPSNFSPIAAMALFGGAYLLRKGYSILIPIGILFLTDLLLNNTSLGYVVDSGSFTFFHSYQIWVYLPMILLVFLGRKLRKNIKLSSIVGYTLLGSIVFFLVSNFGSFLTLPMYTKDLNGLMNAYINGIPFFRNAVLGNLFYSIVLFGAYEWIQNRSSILKFA